MQWDHSALSQAKFWAKVDTSGGPDACWLWTGSLSTQGYGYFWLGSKNIVAHRYAYEDVVGEIPHGLTIDHVCHNEDKTCVGLRDKCPHRRCVNLRHLRPETLGDNRRAASRPRPDQRREQPETCPKGHPYDGLMTRRSGYRAGSTFRYCKTCNRENVGRIKQRKASEPVTDDAFPPKG